MKNIQKESNGKTTLVLLLRKLHGEVPWVSRNWTELTENLTLLSRLKGSILRFSLLCCWFFCRLYEFAIQHFLLVSPGPVAFRSMFCHIEQAKNSPPCVTSWEQLMILIIELYSLIGFERLVLLFWFIAWGFIPTLFSFLVQISAYEEYIFPHTLHHRKTLAVQESN